VTSLGSGTDNDLVLRDSSISRHHARLEDTEEGFRLRDLGSTNGTWVNGVRCQRQCLPPESVLALAQHRFRIHYTPTGDAPPPEQENVFAQSLLEKLGLSKKLGAGGKSARAEAEDDPDRDRKRYRLEPDEP
jgi:pSer/pThr/pTyr-binding forkhead associated (FHA) protein